MLPSQVSPQERSGKGANNLLLFDFNYGLTLNLGIVFAMFGE